MSEIWYRTTHYSCGIEPVEVVKVNNKTLVVNEWAWGDKRNERKCSILSDYRSHFRTWDEARNHLLERAEKEVKSLRLELERANGHLGNIKGLRKPESVE